MTDRFPKNPNPARVCTHPWEFAVEPFRIAGGLYYVGNRDVSCHLLDTGDGLVLIDTAFPQTTYLLLESIRRLGFDPADLAYILHVHGHYDHCGGTRALAELTGAKTAMGEDDVDIIHNRPELTWAPEYGLDWYEDFEVDVPLRDGDVIAIGNARIDCVHTPGHMPGTMSYFFAVEEGGKPYRVGLNGGPGLNTLTDAYMAKHDLPASRRDDYLASVERLRRETVDVHIGAHPSQSRTLERQAERTPDENPFIDDASWPAYLDQLAQGAAREWATD